MIPYFGGLLLHFMLLNTFAMSQTLHADLIIDNAAIWTADDSNEWASSLAIHDGRIVYVGDQDGVRSLRGENTNTIDAEGRLVLPGFIDSHVHFLTGGYRLSSVQLRDASTRQEFVDRIAAYAKTVSPGTWIMGGDWDHTLWGGELPDRNWIDSVTPDNPVWINRLDGHMALANSLALQLAGISDSVADVEGGTIVRDSARRLTGVLKDNAMSLVDKAVPDASDELDDRALSAAMQYVAAQGVTSVHDMSGYAPSYAAMKRAHDGGSLTTRIYLAHSVWQWQRVRDMIGANGSGDDWFKIGLLKGFVDGSLGSHTAAFFEPYTDSPSDSGLFVNEMTELRSVIARADEAGLQVAIHAIGDRAISELLDAFEGVGATNGARDRRFRIEHAQHISTEDIPRFSGLNVIASMQPYHAIDDGRWAEKYIGSDRIETTYAFRSLVDAGATVAFGSDWFVAPPTPLEGIYAAVTRRTLDGANPQGWVPRQKISVAEAIASYTIQAAYASFEDDIKGSLEVGKLADVVILEDNIFDIPPEEINQTRVRMTIVGGDVVFQNLGETRE